MGSPGNNTTGGQSTAVCVRDHEVEVKSDAEVQVQQHHWTEDDSSNQQPWEADRHRHLIRAYIGQPLPPMVSLYLYCYYECRDTVE